MKINGNDRATFLSKCNIYSARTWTRQFRKITKNIFWQKSTRVFVKDIFCFLIFGRGAKIFFEYNYLEFALRRWRRHWSSSLGRKTYYRQKKNSQYRNTSKKSWKVCPLFDSFNIQRSVVVPRRFFKGISYYLYIVHKNEYVLIFVKNW